MKVSVLKNDKSTAKDELVLGIATVIMLVAGILLVVYKPAFGLEDTILATSFGVALIVLAVMFIPAIIYRLLTNDKKSKAEE